MSFSMEGIVATEAFSGGRPSFVIGHVAAEPIDIDVAGPRTDHKELSVVVDRPRRSVGTLTFASWNQIGDFLGHVQALRQAA